MGLLKWFKSSDTSNTTAAAPPATSGLGSFLGVEPIKQLKREGHRKMGQHAEERAVLERWLEHTPQARRDGTNIALRHSKLKKKQPGLT